MHLIDLAAQQERIRDRIQSRDFTFVDDIARGTITGLKPLGYEIINLGLNKPIKLLETVHYMERLFDKKAKLEFRRLYFSDVKSTWAEIEKAEEYLEWEPQIQYENGVKLMVDWYLENRGWTNLLLTNEK